MVLATRIKDAKRQGFVEGEAQGHAAGLVEGEAQGEAKKSRETALEMLKDRQPLSYILKYSMLAEKDVYALAKENGFEVVVD